MQKIIINMVCLGLQTDQKNYLGQEDEQCETGD